MGNILSFCMLDKNTPIFNKAALEAKKNVRWRRIRKAKENLATLIICVSAIISLHVLKRRMLYSQIEEIEGTKRFQQLDMIIRT